MAETTQEVMRSLESRNVKSTEFTGNPSKLVGLAGNGQNTFDNLWRSILLGKQAIANGNAINVAFSTIEDSLALRSRTVLADTARTSSMMAAKS